MFLSSRSEHLSKLCDHATFESFKSEGSANEWALIIEKCAKPYLGHTLATVKELWTLRTKFPNRELSGASFSSWILEREEQLSLIISVAFARFKSQNS